MTATPARALIQTGGSCTWETGLLDPDTGLFAYRAWSRNVASARVVGADGYIDVKEVTSMTDKGAR